MTAHALERFASFPLREWETMRDQRGVSYKGEPGTWCDVRKHGGFAKGFVALVCCPRCGEVFALTKDHTVDHDGYVKGYVECTKLTCGFRSPIRLQHFQKNPLYAVAIERWTGDGWVAEMHHVHASSEAQARAQCTNLSGKYRIVSAGPVLGYFVEDTDGKKLSLD